MFSSLFVVFFCTFFSFFPFSVKTKYIVISITILGGGYANLDNFGYLESATSNYSSGYSSSSSSKTRENGDIPGYRSCIEEMMRSNPNAKQRTCCDRLGGSWSQKGSFGTCRK